MITCVYKYVVNNNNIIYSETDQIDVCCRLIKLPFNINFYAPGIN